MIVLYILLGIVLFFALLFSLHLKVFIELEDKLKLRVGYGPVIITLSPKKKKKIKLSDFTYKKHQKRLEKERKKALDLLLGMKKYWESGAVGQLPEVADGDAPHCAGGCAAQAWSVSEFARVYALLG